MILEVENSINSKIGEFDFIIMEITWFSFFGAELLKGKEIEILMPQLAVKIYTAWLARN